MAGYCRAATSAPPPNFSWISQRNLACMGWPSTKENLAFLLNEGVSHLITLSPEKLPPIRYMPQLEWTLIPIREFDVPTLCQINQFIDICRVCRSKKKAVGIHCRQGKGRTGTMAACYLVYFENLPPQRAVINIRLERPGSIETYQQEKMVERYHDYLRRRQGDDSS